jgi:hypothetical protein
MENPKEDVPVKAAEEVAKQAEKGGAKPLAARAKRPDKGTYQPRHRHGNGGRGAARAGGGGGADDGMMDRGGYNPLWRSQTENHTTYDRTGEQGEAEEETEVTNDSGIVASASAEHPDNM